eukprot:m.196108 g.196108  ORF g.196108 m.196108 type:complete len:51 (-) comp15694_c0_seq28:2920-3072(-)
MNWNEAYLDEAEELPITERHVISNYEGRLVIIGDVHGDVLIGCEEAHSLS